MIPIPEERLTAKTRQLLEEHLRGSLLLIQEQQDDEVVLEPLRSIVTDTVETGPEDLPCASLVIKKGELSEKDRVLKNEVYLLQIKITFTGRDQARQAYRYAAAVQHLLDRFPTLYGACRRAVLKEKEYLLSRLPGDADCGSVRLTLRAVLERV